MMSVTIFVFIGYLLFVAFTPTPFNLGFYCTLLLISLFVDLFSVGIQFLGGFKNVYS